MRLGYSGACCRSHPYFPVVQLIDLQYSVLQGLEPGHHDSADLLEALPQEEGSVAAVQGACLSSHTSIQLPSLQHQSTAVLHQGVPAVPRGPEAGLPQA